MALGTQDFFGKDGTARWFIGQVPLSQAHNKTDPYGWGDRVQVRILGSDPSEGTQLNDKDLRWALIPKPTSQGTLNQSSTGIIGGEWVVGIFLDDSKETCMIFGVLGRSDPKYYVKLEDQVSKGSTEFKSTFNYWGSMQPQSHQMAGGGSSPKGNTPVPAIPLSDYGKFNTPPQKSIPT